MCVSASCSFSSPECSCSLEGIGSQILPLLACKLDMTSHLVSLGVSSGKRTSQNEHVSEVDLILNRAGNLDATLDTVSDRTIIHL